MRLQNKILLPILAVLILSFAFISFMSVTFTTRTANEIVESQMLSVADSVSHQIKSADDIISIVLGMMDKKNISLAQALAYIIAEEPGNLEPDKMESLARLFNVDEVHVTDENGILLWGNVADFYGFDFHDTEQTLPLLAILDDPTLTIAQEPMPRGTDGVMFQYICVSRLDQRGIVQVGVSMSQIDDIKSSMSVQNTIEGMHIGQNGGAFVLDLDGKVVADSTKTLMGKDMSIQEWFATMLSGKEGRLKYEYDGAAYESYYRLVDEYIIVTYILESEIKGYANSSLINIILIGIAATVIVTLITVFLIRWVVKKMYWYENILDCIPFPLSITDKNRKWTFINKAVEDFLNKKRADVLGSPCSNWGAGICNTPNCGINCLEHGKTETLFNQMGMDFKVNTSYLTDADGHKIGHIEMVQDISEMVKSQKAEADLVKEIGQISRNFVSTSKSISGDSQALAKGSEEQAAAIDQLSSSISKVSDKTKANADMANQAALLADTIKNNAEKGSRQMAEMMSAVKEINHASQSINKVIKVIDDIAFQTNILALNAAVEAARAGQHGKGFAVVAEEVRNLAAKSAEAAKDTGGLIANSMEKAEMGARIADETAASLNEIVSGINDSSMLVSKIAKSSEEQSSGISQINIGIDQVAQVVQQNSATAKESAASSNEMNAQAYLLEELILQFKSSAVEERKSLPDSNTPE